MYPRNTANAKRGYAKRELKRKQARKEASAGWKPINQETTPKEGKMNAFWRSIVIVGLVCMTVLCIGGMAVSYFATRPVPVVEAPVVATAPPVIPTEAPVVAPTNTAAPEATKAPVATEVAATLPFAQAETCVGITANADQSYVEKALAPGQTFAGDIEIFIDNGCVQVHDSGIGEYTVVRNTGTTDVLTRGRWGAGCLLKVNQKIVVNGEFDNPNHGDLVAVRDVEVKNGSYTETFFYSPLP